MNKSNIIGFVLIALTLFGFSWYQTNQYKKQVAYQEQLDSLARVEMLEKLAQEEAYKAAHPEAEVALETAHQSVGHNSYKDSCLNLAAEAAGAVYTLENSVVEIKFNSRGAQPYSVKIKDYYTCDSTDLYLVKPGYSELGFQVYAGEYINTKDLTFSLASLSDNAITFRLPFSNGGYIEQVYTLEEGSYMVQNQVNFVGLEEIIPRNVSSVDIDWSLVIPRLEKGYRNEAQYSQLDYRFPDDKKVNYIGRSRNGNKRLNVQVSWFAFQQQFFSGILRAKSNFNSADLGVNFYGNDDENGNLMACAASLNAPIEGGAVKTLDLEYYFGPNHYKTLKSYDQKYEKIIPLGGWIVGWISRYAIIPSFNFFGRFISNYGVVILIMTLLLKVILFPFTYKSTVSSVKMSIIKPEVDKLNAKYPKQEDAMKKQQAQMALYKRAGISPMGGCLPMLFQFPILFAMFRFFPASIELRQQHFLWASDLSAYDSILNLPFNIPLYGDHVSLFALLMAVTMFFYSKMTSAQMSSDPNMAGMKFMSLYMMPIMMLFICNNLSSALSYYYLLSNLITMLQTWIIRRYGVDEKKLWAQLKATEGKPLPKSKWQQRLEEAQKMQEEMARRR